MLKGAHSLTFFYCCCALLASLHRPVSALSCFECSSTFPASQICLPPCSTSFRANSTCLLTRNIPLVPTTSGSLRAGHVGEEPSLADASEKNFIFGEEAVYLNPSQAVGWNWNYGPITYGCDTNGCNDPKNINRLSDAWKPRIPTATLDRLLTGNIVSNCTRCSTCLDENFTGTEANGCVSELCASHACGFVATRASPLDPQQCQRGWRFASFCIGSREPAQVDMTLMYYLQSKKSVVYQLEAICLSDNCNSPATFKQLKDNITVESNLDCLLGNSNSSTTSTSTRPNPSTPSGTTGTPISTTVTPTSAVGTISMPKILLSLTSLFLFFSWNDISMAHL